MMAGGREFDPRRYDMLAAYVLDHPTRIGGRLAGSDLSTVMFLLDMNAYRTLGASLTGATWTRGRKVPEARERDLAWHRRFVANRQPIGVRIAGALIALYAAARRVR
jgi:hypothetical protein